MLFNLKEIDGLIYSYMEWNVVDALGKTADDGKYLFIRDLWIHEDYKDRESIAQFIFMLDNDNRTKYVKGIYWERETKTEDGTFQRKSKLFKRTTCLRRVIKLLQEA